MELAVASRLGPRRKPSGVRQNPLKDGRRALYRDTGSRGRGAFGAGEVQRSTRDARDLRGEGAVRRHRNGQSGENDQDVSTSTCASLPT